MKRIELWTLAFLAAMAVEACGGDDGDGGDRNGDTGDGDGDGHTGDGDGDGGGDGDGHTGDGDGDLIGGAGGGDGDEAVAEFTVSYDGNGHTSGSVPDAMDYEDGSSVTVAGPGDLELTGYSFDSWTLPGTGAVNGGSMFTLAGEDAELVANWSPNEYLVTFDKNDGAATGTMTDQTFVYDSPGTLTALGYSHPSEAFLGWAESDSGDPVYGNGATFMTPASPTTLYAVWVPFEIVSISYENGPNTLSRWDQGDSIVITFSAEVDPTSIHASLTKGGTLVSGNATPYPWINCQATVGNEFALVNGDNGTHNLGAFRVEGTGTMGPSNDGYLDISLDATGTVLTLTLNGTFVTYGNVMNTSDTNYIGFTPSSAITSLSGAPIVVQESKPENGTTSF